MPRNLSEQLRFVDFYCDSHQQFSVYDHLTDGSVYFSKEDGHSDATIKFDGVSLPQEKLFEVIGILAPKHEVNIAVRDKRVLDVLYKLEKYLKGAEIYYAGTVLSPVNIWGIESKDGIRTGTTEIDYLSDKHWKLKLFDELFETVFGVKLPSYDPQYSSWWCDERREFVEKRGFKWDHKYFTPPNSKETIHYTQISKERFVPENVHETLKNVLSLLEKKKIAHEPAIFWYEKLKTEDLFLFEESYGIRVTSASDGNGDLSKPKYSFSINSKGQKKIRNS